MSGQGEQLPTVGQACPRGAGELEKWPEVLLSSHGRGIRPLDALKDSQDLSRVLARLGQRHLGPQGVRLLHGCGRLAGGTN